MTLFVFDFDGVLFETDRECLAIAYRAVRELPEAWAECLEVRARYRGYIEREERLAARRQELDELPLPDALWALDLRGLSREAVEKLGRWRPATVGQASRIAGVSPSDVAVLLVHARRVRAQQRA